jgi:site-specific DNA-cytosine methylase
LAFHLCTGKGIVSNEFVDRGFNLIASIDVDKNSNATMKVDIRDVDPYALSAVADCVWASPDCKTYSQLGGGTHRAVSSGELTKSDTAHLNDEVFVHLMRIMAFTKAKHPHCIFIIENPAGGSLNEMPCKFFFDAPMSTKSHLTEPFFLILKCHLTKSNGEIAAHYPCFMKVVDKPMQTHDHI